MQPAEEEDDMIEAGEALASFASQQQPGQIEQDHKAPDDEEDDDDDQMFTRKPFTRTMQKQERDALQKWVQCAKCAKWRKVPFTLKDEDISEEWECKDNKWDRIYAACTMAQALTDEEIDDILAGQQSALEARPLPTNEQEAAAADVADGLQETSKQAPNRTRPSRNKTKKVTSGATDEEIAEHAARPRPPRSAAVRQLQRTRPKPKNGKLRAGAGKHISDAAEALLGMGSGFADEDMLNDDDGDDIDDDLGAAYPAGSFRPGRVVWAKVDGHEWWPAKVVRRRAVPREVGAPPGGPTLVHTQIPVVFFTQSGIPGEMTDELVSSQGPVAVCVQAMQHIGSDSKADAEEAEYAWLSLDCLKPFREGDSLAFEEDKHITDLTLKACIAAAEHAVKAAADRASAAAAEEEEDDAENMDSQSDSDGGWAYTHADPLGTPRQAQKGRQRMTKPRKGRVLKGSKKAKGKSGRAGWDDEEELVANEVPLADPYGRAPPPVLAAPVVESVYGWRWPMSQHEYDREYKSQKPEEASDPARTRDQASAQPKSEHAQHAGADGAIAESGSQHDGLQQEEADAVAALLAAASGLSSQDMDNSTPYPSGSEKEAEYLVKWVGKAHIHNEWVPETLLMRIARRKVVNFKRRHGHQPCNLTEPAWTQPCRFICRRPCLSGPGWEALVKWCDLGYEEATWEMEGEGILVQAQTQKLHQELWQRQHEAVVRSQPEAAEAAAAAKQAAIVDLPPLTEQPDWIQQGQLYPHQLQGVSWLREQWRHGANAALADEKGLGRTATIITFLQCLRNEFHCPGPVMVAVQASELKAWEGEWEFWGGQGLHVVSYSGSTAAKAVIHEHELWLSPGCLDGKAPKRLKGDLANKVIQPDVVLVTFDALVSDNSQLQPIDWEAIVVDERNTVQPILAKAHQAVKELECNCRVLMMPSSPATMSFDSLMQSLHFIDPAVEDLDLDSAAQQQRESESRKELASHTLRRTRSEISRFTPPTAEVVLPVMMTQRQRECYKAHLARAYEVLTDPKTPRQNSHRGANLRAVCQSLKKVCDHPFLLPDFEPTTAGSAGALAASGKLVVLDKLLRHLHSHNHSVLLLSHHAKVLDMIADHCRQKLPNYPVQHIHDSASAAAQHEAIEEHNADGPGLLLMDTRSCGLGTNLSGTDTVILFDSDWNPRRDVQALSMAHCIGKADVPSTVYRLVSKGTLEERVQQLADKKKGSDVIFRSSHSKTSPAAVHIMEDALMWGVEHVFSRHRYPTETTADTDTPASSRPTSAASPASTPGDVKMEDAETPKKTSPNSAQEAATPTANALASAAGSRPGTPSSVSPEPMIQSPFGAPEQQQPQHRSKSKSRHSADKHKGHTFQPLYTDSVVDKLIQWAESQFAVQQEAASAGAREQSLAELLGQGWGCVKLHQWDPAQLEDAGDEGDDEDAREDLECPDLDAADDPVIKAMPSGSAAKFWEGLLKDKHEQLLREEEQQVRHWQSSQLHHTDTSPPLDPADEAGNADYGEEGEEDEGMGLRQSSGLSHLPEFGADEHESLRSKRRRPMKASTRLGGKTHRRRRLDEEDEHTEEVGRLNMKRKRGVHHETGRLPVDRAEYDALLRERQHQEEVLQRLADSSTAEGRVVQKALQRMTELVDNLNLDDAHIELAQELSQILMMLRPDGDAASDFQDYTLLAVVAVAAHLCNSHHKDHFIAALAQRYHTDASALHTVFEYIVATAQRFRHTHSRMIAVLGEQGMSHMHAGLLNGSRQAGDSMTVRVDSERQASRPVSADHHHAVAQPPSVIMNSDMEAFGNRLSAIVNADFYNAALNAGPVDVPLGPLQALSAHLPADSSAQAAHTEEVLKQLRQMQEQVALFDRIHNIRVKHIQEEYQKYMERVRSKAQGAIDQANGNYQHHRAMLTARVDTLVQYLQQQYLRTPAPHVYHDEGRLQQFQQLHQQQLLQQQQSQQQQPQQQLPTDAEARQAPASSSAATAVAEPVQIATSAVQQPAAGSADAGKQASGQTPTVSAAQADTQPHPKADQQQGTLEGAPESTAAPHGPTTSASGMSLQPPSLPADFAQQQPQQAAPAQIATSSAQQQPAVAEAAAAAVAASASASGSPREGPSLGLAGGQKQAPKPPLAPGSKTVPQHVLLARQLNQPAQHLPLKGLTQQQQSQVLNQYNHDQQRATAPMQNMRRAGPVVLAGHPTREVPSQTVHAILQQGGLHQTGQGKTKLTAATSSPTPLASLVSSQTQPHTYPHGFTVQSGAPSMVPPSHPKPIQTGPSADFSTARVADLTHQASQQARAMREGSPSHPNIDIRIGSDAGAAERPLPTSAVSGGAASYGASTMGITRQPSQPHAAPPSAAAAAAGAAGASHRDDESMGEPSRSRSPSPSRDGSHGCQAMGPAVQMLTQQPAVNAFAAAAAAALPVPQAVVSPRRVSLLRGGPVAGSYIDGRQVTTGSGELPAHIGHGLEADDRFGRGSARKTDASRYAVKADSGSGRSMHASPARLIITSGAPGPPNRDMALARAASGDLSRADSGSLRAPRSPSISVITAPLPMQQTAEGPVQRHRLASPQPTGATTAASGHHSIEQPAIVRNDATQLSGRGDSDSHRERQVTSQEGLLPTAMTPQQQLVNAQAAGQVPGSPFPPRVDSLSHWARHVDAQQRSSSPQVNGFAAT